MWQQVLPNHPAVGDGGTPLQRAWTHPTRLDILEK